MEMRVGANDVEILSEHLYWQILKVEDKSRPGMHMQFSIAVCPVLPKRCAEKANWTLHLVRLLGPSLSSTVGRRRAYIILGRKRSATACSNEVLLSIEANASLDDCACPGMLGDDSPEQLATSD